MQSLRGTCAVVIGASSGVGKATARALVSEGARVVAVGRSAERLRVLAAELGGGVETVAADAAEPETAERLLREYRPDLVVLAAGVRPHVAPIDEQSWEAFSEAWGSDVKAAFHLVKSAIALPLRPGSAVVVVSSGAAIQGSHMSGGYAGAKRMQWLLAGYAQKLSDARQLGLRFVAVVPKQLIEGTAIAERASVALGAWLGISAQAYMQRFDVPLDPDKVARAILAGARGEGAPAATGDPGTTGATAVAVTGSGIEWLG
jgi:NAD(P)-dependent dehydrogenase (short-subunit alcohol dehydrogenase family)